MPLTVTLTNMQGQTLTQFEVGLTRSGMRNNLEYMLKNKMELYPTPDMCIPYNVLSNCIITYTES
jgi:hypothetical protein